MAKPLYLAAVVMGAGVATWMTLSSRPVAADESARTGQTFDDPTGRIATLSVNGDVVDETNPFFEDLGTNGRRCSTCHRPEDGMTVTPAHLQERFAATRGRDPIFRPNDGSNCEGVDPPASRGRAAAYSLLLNKGLIRIGIDVPADAEFVIDSVDDPYRCGASLTSASMYRRPLPATNLRFLSAVMWDGRESSPTTTILQDLAHQANEATRGHAMAVLDLTPAQRQQIVDFEMGLFTAQSRDEQAGNLHARRAEGGPVALSHQLFFIGINDPVGLNPTGAPFDPSAFTLFDAWASLRGSTDEGLADARRSVARGQNLFNTKPITLSGVAGLNDQTFSNGVTLPAAFSGTCTTCHDAPNAGDHSVKAPLNIGLTDESRRTPDMPLYTLRRVSDGAFVKTTDPGRAMITGKWADIGKFKGPILRGLAARAPYFHNGLAATLQDLVEFYDTRFEIGLTTQEKMDLVAFLRSL
jgi:cytochrome c peroxidase